MPLLVSLPFLVLLFLQCCYCRWCLMQVLLVLIIALIVGAIVAAVVAVATGTIAGSVLVLSPAHVVLVLLYLPVLVLFNASSSGLISRCCC
jgi:hypothetical protein